MSQPGAESSAELTRHQDADDERGQEKHAVVPHEEGAPRDHPRREDAHGRAHAASERREGRQAQRQEQHVGRGRERQGRKHAARQQEQLAREPDRAAEQLGEKRIGQQAGGRRADRRDHAAREKRIGDHRLDDRQHRRVAGALELVQRKLAGPEAYGVGRVVAVEIRLDAVARDAARARHPEIDR